MERKATDAMQELNKRSQAIHSIMDNDVGKASEKIGKVLGE